MTMILFMAAACGLIGVLSFKYGTYVGYDMACDEIIKDLKEVDNRIRVMSEEESV